MGASFFIPKKINVGFQNRSGTYTGKLAYVIYFDEKGKLRKETSWNGWRDKKIDNQIFDNEPTSGFVLNKKVGDYVSDWNHRQAYVRVYDPRDFEFEITIQNLLYILENATSTKGKGLEGDFVYGWDGKDLVLIPCEAPDYQELVKLNELRHSESKIGAKELKIGATYRTRQNDEWIYIGKFDEYGWRGEKSKKPKFWFYNRKSGGYFETITSVTQKIVEVISSECVADYADIFDKLECKSSYSPIDESKTVYTPYGLDEFKRKVENNRWINVYTNFDSEDDTMKRENVGKNYNGKYYYYKKEWAERRVWSYSKPERYLDSVCVYVDTIEDLFNIVKPCKKLKYLANGKFYGEE